MKKTIALIMALIMAVFAAGCSKGGDAEPEGTAGGQKAQNAIRIDELGLEVAIPDSWRESSNVNPSMFGPVDEPGSPIYGGVTYDFISNEKLEEMEHMKEKGFESEDEAQRFWLELFSSQKKLANIVVFYSDRLEKGEDMGEYTQCDQNELIAETGGFAYYFCYNDMDSSGLSEESANKYESLYAEKEALKESIGTFEPVEPSDMMGEISSMPEFKAQDIFGSEVDSGIFSEYKLTMVNIWGTFCSPCIEEMPELQSLYEKMNEKGVNVIGIVGDTPDPDNEELARIIADKKGVEFTNIIPDESIQSELLPSIVGYPTSIFVDGEGNVVGKPVVGARSGQEYEEIIMNILEGMN